MLKHFKMYILITEVLGQKRIHLAYLIQGKKIATVSMFSENVQCKIKEPVKVLLITNEEMQLLKGMFTSMFIGRKLKVIPLVTKIKSLPRWISWHASHRWLSAWTNLTTLTTCKLEYSASSYLGITWLVLKSLLVLNQLHPSIRV